MEARYMLRFLSNRWSLLCLVVLIAGISGGAVAFGEHASNEQLHRAEIIDGQRVLRAPDLDDWNERQASPKNNPGQSGRFGSAFHYDAFVYAKAESNPKVAGIVRRGDVIKVGDKVSGSGCKDGSWYKGRRLGTCAPLSASTWARRRARTGTESRRPRPAATSRISTRASSPSARRATTASRPCKRRSRPDARWRRKVRRQRWSHR